jgi:beta-mannosidase
MKRLTRVDLGGSGWQLREVGGEAGPFPAVVPGTVHTDLMAAGAIPDPFLETNEKDVLWVLEKDWCWKRSFEVNADLLERERVELIFEGIDTAATVLLNDKEIAASDNMYVPLRIDVKSVLRIGDNELEVRIESPTRIRDQRAAAESLELRQAADKAAAYLRKAPYSYSWDWGPELPTSGIWKPVYLEAGEARLADVFPRAEMSADMASARLDVSVEVRSAASGAAELVLKLSGHGLELELTESVELAAGTSTHAITFEVENPELWWPNGYGAQPLYELATELRAGGEVLDTDSRRVGFRKIELVREADEIGESFYFKVNDFPVFCRGANWIPDDSFLPRLTPDALEKSVGMARDANMNMLRVWGGGVYESDDFYDLCDRMGILVWQDFCFACGMYPDHLDSFRDSVRAEAEANVKRLRGRTSLALLCGNNECHQGWFEWGWQKSGKWDRFYGEKLYHEVLPDVVARLAAHVPYWPGSSYGGETPSSQSHGDMHYWKVWHSKQPAENYETLTCRFLSEFGFESGPAMKTVREFTAEPTLTPTSPVMLHHERCSDGPAKLKQYLETEFGPVTDQVPLWIYRSQYVQAHCVGTALRHTRRRFPDCGGVLFWQHNDCWPVTSWSCMDHKCRPKALWFQTKRDFAPAAISLADVDGELSAWVSGNRPEDAPAGEVQLKLLDFAGKVLFEKTVAFGGARDFRPAKVWSASRDQVGLGDGRGKVLVADYLVEGRRLARAVRTFVNCKDQPLGEVKVTLEVKPSGDAFDVTVSTDRVVLGLMLTAGGEASPFSDNFLYLLPGEKLTVQSAVGDDIEYLHAGS